MYISFRGEIIETILIIIFMEKKKKIRLIYISSRNVQSLGVLLLYTARRTIPRGDISKLISYGHTQKTLKKEEIIIIKKSQKPATPPAGREEVPPVSAPSG